MWRDIASKVYHVLFHVAEDALVLHEFYRVHSVLSRVVYMNIQVCLMVLVESTFCENIFFVSHCTVGFASHSIKVNAGG